VGARDLDDRDVPRLQPGGDAGSGRAGRADDSDSGRHSTCFRSLAEHEGNIQGKMQYPGKLRPNQRLAAGSRGANSSWFQIAVPGYTWQKYR
jgi:hypothetical protein